MPAVIPKMLVFRFGQIGDTIAALPSLWVLRQHFPESRLVMLSEAPSSNTHFPPETVLPKIGLVDGFEKYPAGSSIKHFVAAFRQIRQLRAQGFDALVYLTPSLRSKRQRSRDQMFFRLCGIKRCFMFKGFPDDLHPKLSNGTLLRQPREADSLLGRLSLDGFKVPDAEQGCMDLRITEYERQRSRDWWCERGNPKTPNGWVAVCTGSKMASKLWPSERYGEVVRLLIMNHGLFPVIVGGSEDHQAGERLVSGWGTGLCAAGQLSVRESAGLMERARFYLGNDTGTMHLAAAVGIPCVAIFSARDWPGRWHPYGNGHQILRFDVPCSGCLLEICDRELQCLRGIQIQDVYEACRKVLNSFSSPNPNSVQF